MTVEYQKVWRTMNDLELVTSKICSARANIDVAIDKLQEHQYDKAEILMNAAYEYLEYYLKDFDEKFKLAWQATVGDLRDGDVRQTYSCDKDDKSLKCQKAWNDFWEQNYYPEENQQYTEEELNSMCDAAESQSKVKKWILPVEIDGPSGEYFVMFPDDLLEASDLQVGDQVHWVDNKDGSYTIRKVTKSLKMEEC